MTVNFILKEDLSFIRSQSEAFIEEFNSTDILISGASGFVGNWLTLSILELQERKLINGNLSLVTRNGALLRKRLLEKGAELSKVKIIESDLGSGNLSSRMPQSSYGLIFHCATPASTLTSEITENEILIPSIAGLEEIMASAVSKDGKTVLINLSSGAVYGNACRSRISIPENLEPVSTFTTETSYTKAKVVSENLIIDATNKGNLLGCNPRLFAFAGPGIPLNQKFAVGDFVSACLGKRVIKIEGSPLTTRSYLYPAELAVLLLRTAVRPTLSTLHIGSSESLSMLEIARMTNKVFNGEGLELDNTDINPNHYVPVINKTVVHLDYQPMIGFEESLTRWEKSINPTN